MNIEEVKAEKAKLAQGIFNLIRDFETSTKTHIVGVELTHSQEMGCQPRLRQVELENRIL